jgi:thiamine-monophosphate kinase
VRAKSGGDSSRRFGYDSHGVPLPETELIARIARLASSGARKAMTGLKSGIAAGIGDDCAVLRLPPGHEILVTTDFTLEDVHFRREWHSAESVGHRCLARGLSDIAAMGGLPFSAFLSLALPRKLRQNWVEGFMRGLLKLAAQFGVALAGGDTAQSAGGILADIVVVGSAPHGEAILRSGARAGDRIYVTGSLGGSAAAIERMTQKLKLNPRDYRRHFFPEPRLKIGRILREKHLASAMIDTSDGLSTDLAHICDRSGVGARVEAEALPRAAVGKSGREVDLQLALHGGEDYELLFTSPPGKRVPSRIAGVPVTQIGVITRARKIILEENGVESPLVPRGWEHFRK